MAYKRWIIADADKEKASLLSEKLNIDPFIAFLLVTRGVDNELTASDFLSKTYKVNSPFLFKDMKKAVERIKFAIDDGEKICIYGDYDCDGVTSTALLYNFFESIGADVIYYIPDRVDEGYGMNKDAVDYIKSQGVNLIVTVDNGISSFEEAEYIYELGMELIITDHHQVGDKLPRAAAVINPHREDDESPFKDYAGVGVAFKLVSALYDGEITDLLNQYADLVAIGTIGDVVPLLDENRSLVRAGLESINNNSRLGIKALKRNACCVDKTFSSTDVAFILCPRINAAGRVGHAYDALNLLICDNYQDANYNVSVLNDDNRSRHEIESDILSNIKNKIKNDHSIVENKVIVIDGNNYHPGVIGITASRLVEIYGKPTIIIGVDENGECTGSARSVEGFNIYEALSSCKDILTHYGGHPLAAGLGLNKKNIDIFKKRINDFAIQNYPVMPVYSLKLDCKLSPFYLNLDLVNSLTSLEPYGTNNKNPIFCLSKVKLISVTSISDGKHIRFEVEKKNKRFSVVMFGKTLNEFPYSKGTVLDLAVKLSKNLYKGKWYLSIQAIDIHKSYVDEDAYFYQKEDFESFKLGKKNKTKLYPERDVCAVIYKYLKLNNGWKYSFDDLYFNLQDSVTYGQLYYALKAFEQTNLIENDKSIKLIYSSGKVDLDNTEVLRNLKGMLKSE